VPVTRKIERTELIVPGPSEALAALLDVPVPDLEAGEELPLLWHWLYLLDRPAIGDLGPDGHPVRGTIPAPPEAGRRRMWAGGRVRRLAALRCGEDATRRTTVAKSVDKQGRTGPMTFVTVLHQISQAGQVVLEEEQDIVYRAAAQHDGATTTARDEGEREAAVPSAPADWEVETPVALLFRFSALTYNGHRIHYDREYARDVEGYPGLVVHGPLQALLMTEAVRRQGAAVGAGTRFEYRLVSPVFDFDGLVVSTEPSDSDGPDAVTTSVRSRSGRTSAAGMFQP
jgi:3-methylfumaryl-CoA hydratase